MEFLIYTAGFVVYTVVIWLHGRSEGDTSGYARGREDERLNRTDLVAEFGHYLEEKGIMRHDA